MSSTSLLVDNVDENAISPRYAYLRCNSGVDTYRRFIGGIYLDPNPKDSKTILKGLKSTVFSASLFIVSDSSCSSCNSRSSSLAVTSNIISLFSLSIPF